ncbi:MAG: hypothetical protein K2X02_08570 [Alphaproteobacteria bacterium]|nr:hypothetical protein [Alphaproteobacteria bacterium]
MPLQFNQLDPDNHLVALGLERFWKKTLQKLRQAEESFSQRKKETLTVPLPEDLKLAFLGIGKNLSEIWSKDILS